MSNIIRFLNAVNKSKMTCFFVVVDLFFSRYHSEFPNHLCWACGSGGLWCSLDLFALLYYLVHPGPHCCSAIWPALFIQHLSGKNTYSSFELYKICLFCVPGSFLNLFKVPFVNAPLQAATQTKIYTFFCIILIFLYNLKPKWLIYFSNNHIHKNSNIYLVVTGWELIICLLLIDVWIF